MSMNRRIAVASAFVVALGLVAFLFVAWMVPRIADDTADIRLPDGTLLMAEISDDDAERALGLSFRNQMAVDGGMLFLFDLPVQPEFWMKGMEFPIDIIWIKGETIVGITADVPVPTGADLPKYGPNVPIDRVLEVNAGFAAAHGLVPGDLLDIRLP